MHDHNPNTLACPHASGRLGSCEFPHPAGTNATKNARPIEAGYMMGVDAEGLLVDEVVPRIRSLMPSLNPVAAEDREELAQDAIALAAALLKSTQARGKQVSAGNVSYYAVKLVRQGRRSTGQSKTDVMHPCTQLAGRTRLVSLDAALADEAYGEETLSLHDVLAGQTEDPALAASRRLDWQRLSAFLDPAAREIVACLIQGEDLTTLVPKLKRSRSALQADKNRLARLVREHLGSDILTQVQVRPSWMNNIAANREKKECLYANRTLGDSCQQQTPVPPLPHGNR